MTQYVKSLELRLKTIMEELTQYKKLAKQLAAQNAILQQSMRELNDEPQDWTDRNTEAALEAKRAA